MDARCKELVDITGAMLSARGSLLTLWQEIAENFYPERADFTTSRMDGDEFASHLMSGVPLLARRDMANLIAAMLRPKGKDWFGLAPEDNELAEHPSVIEWAKDKCGVMRRAMYDPVAQFTRATKEGDQDFATFGQPVLTVELNEATQALLFRCWHLRDTAWSENDAGQIDWVARNWKMQARTLCKRFPNKVSQAVKGCLGKEPFKEIQCRHIVLPFDEYDYSKDGKRPRQGQFAAMGLLVDCENNTILSETPLVESPYVIPRWQTLPGSPYAVSPAAMTALPDARLLQRMTFTLLQAGEKAVDPPMMATQEAIRSDIALYAGGITWVDAEYDERKGEPLRPLAVDKSGLQFGLELAEKYEQIIKAGFYLNQIMLPPITEGDMTATEANIRLQEQIRSVLPLFEPVESEYNGQLCEKTFNILMRGGAFGNPDGIPDVLKDQQLKWTFESPLSEAAKKQDAVSFQEAMALTAQAVGLDPSLAGHFDAKTAYRKAMLGIGAPLVDEEEADAAAAEAAEQAQMQQGIAQVGGGAAAAEQVGKAIQSFQPPQQGRRAA